MEKEFNEALGKALREQREIRKLKQQDIADRMHVTKITVSRWESGKRSLTAENLHRYCKILGVSVDYIFDRT